MLKNVLILFTVLLLSACGVETSSSDVVETTVNGDTDSNDSSNSDGSTDANDSTGTNDSTDTNTSTGTDDENVTIKSIFDIRDAVEDKFACILGDNNDGYTNNVVSDDSYDHADTWDEEDGIGVNSRFPNNTDIEDTKVAVFYNDLKPARWLSDVNIYEDDFRISVDRAWANNDETIIYARTPKDENDLFWCYRYDLDAIDINSTVVGVKVFRREIE